MRILRHRANTPALFREALLAGFGAELDIRDAGRELVVAHGLPGKRAVKLARFFGLYARLNPRPTLALNIKACGLQGKLLALLEKFGIGDYFVFDMAVPDGVEYLKLGMKLFTRQSEYERVPAYYGGARGVWLDDFGGRRPGPGVIRGHLAKKKLVCVVSPELHKRDFRATWRHLKKLGAGSGRLLLCTDHPREADRYFNGRD